ncbi:MAG: 50S ribosomal protein L11 methyltransferase [Pyrinomonadaceae bacterium]
MIDGNRSWLAVEITVDAGAVEAIEFALNELDAIGSEINLLGVREPQAAICVTGYFHKKPDEGIFDAQMTEALRIYGFSDDSIESIAWREVENTDWLAEWKKHWQPTTVGRFVVAPPWSEVADTERIVIRIEPNMAFGTGTHETTQLCLKAIDENYFANMSLLDVGTGTGILAIAAAKLASRRVGKNNNALSVGSVSSVAKILACDTDVDSITIARENAIANGVGERIDFALATITGETANFDLVCANLTLDVITPLLPLLIAKSRRTLLLSGILAEQADAITTELRKFQITDFEIERSGEWISVLIRKS